METYLCDKCNKLFYERTGAAQECPYCKSKYFVWVTWSGRTKKEVEALIARAVEAGTKTDALPRNNLG